MLRFPPILILWNYFSKRKVKDILGKCSTCLCTAPEKIILVASHPSAALLHVLHIQTLNAQPFKPKSFSLSRLPNCGWNKAFIKVTSNIHTAHKVCVHVVWSSTICVYRTVKWQRRIHAQLSLTNYKNMLFNGMDLQHWDNKYWFTDSSHMNIVSPQKAILETNDAFLSFKCAF